MRLLPPPLLLHYIVPLTAASSTRRTPICSFLPPPGGCCCVCLAAARLLPAGSRTAYVALWQHRHPPLQSLKRLSAAAPGCCLPPLYHSHCTCTCRDSARRRGRRRCARSPTPLSRTEFPPGDDSTRAQQVSGQSSETHVTPEASQVGRYASRGHVACDHQVAGTLAGWHGKLCTDRSKTANELFFLGVRPEHDQVRWSQVQEVLCRYSVRVALLSSDTSIAVC
jgi:hypothetical protein